MTVCSYCRSEHYGTNCPNCGAAEKTTEDVCEWIDISTHSAPGRFIQARARATGFTVDEAVRGMRALGDALSRVG